MALILRIDVDRPYGKRPFVRHVLSRLRSDLYAPVLESFGYLRELAILLTILNRTAARAYVFFRRCTVPSSHVLWLMRAGRHEIGLHLEDSRTFESFICEKTALERHTGSTVAAFSKHGSGSARYGRRHYAPYEPERYVQWALRAQMRLFLGNLEDPSLTPIQKSSSFLYFPSAFWLETPWRDTETFSVDWLRARANDADVVLLVHPENIIADAELLGQFRELVTKVQTKIYE